MRSFSLVLAASCLLSAAGPSAAAPAPALDATERRIAEAIAGRAEEAHDLLERLVAINSGTFNPAGVRAVGEVLAERLAALGFSIEWQELPPEMGRGDHLVARRAAAAPGALHALLIGHLDTVFEADDPFQDARRDGEVLHGPGALDMKGGDVAIVSALEGLAAAGALDALEITAYFTSDEESPGLPLSVSRAGLVAAAEAADVALGFESGCCREGADRAVIARRSSVPWLLEVESEQAHSSGIFSEEVGAGSAFEAARILHTFYTELAGEEALTFSAGVVLAGSEVAYDAEAHRGTAFGKTNVVPGRAIAHGGLRALTPEQLAGAQERMREIVGRHLPRTAATLEFEEGYPPMPPTEGNRRLLDLYDRVSRDLGLGPVEAFPPAERGAADVSFAAPYTDALGGLGPEGEGSHGPGERLDLPTLVESSQRAGLLLHRLAETEPGTPSPGARPAALPVVYLVRHAEKVEPYPDDPDDPPLTAAGRERAQELARTLADAGITRILSSDYRRTRETAAPLADLLGLEVELYDPRALEDVAVRLAGTGERVLVVGHSNTTPHLVELLGGEPGPPIDEAREHDRLYVLSGAARDEVVTVRLRYGGPADPRW